MIPPSKGLNPSESPNGKIIRSQFCGPTPTHHLGWQRAQGFILRRKQYPTLYYPHLVPGHPWEKLTVLLFAEKGWEGWHSTEAKLELWSLPFGLISYRLTFNCCFFLSDFNHNVSYVLSLPTQNNWPFFALLSSLFSPFSPNRRGLQDNVRKGGQCSGCEISISGSSSSGPMQNYKINCLHPWLQAPF